jgi:hypothetical protein
LGGVGLEPEPDPELSDEELLLLEPESDFVLLPESLFSLLALALLPPLPSLLLLSLLLLLLLLLP